jgi:hypothetical protein
LKVIGDKGWVDVRVSFESVDEMIAGVGGDHIADFSDFEFEGRIFEGFLHLSSFEVSQITASLAAGALGILGGKLLEQFRVILQLLFELFNVGEGFLRLAGDLFVAEGIEGSSGLRMFLKDVCAAN